jgi:hypothetical protein
MKVATESVRFFFRENSVFRRISNGPWQGKPPGSRDGHNKQKGKQMEKQILVLKFSVRVCGPCSQHFVQDRRSERLKRGKATESLRLLNTRTKPQLY